MKRRMLFLDEPTIGIDPQSRKTTGEPAFRFGPLRHQHADTTHYMEEAEKICSRVAIIDEGRIISQGSPEDLIEGHPGCDHLGAVFLD